MTRRRSPRAVVNSTDASESPRQVAHPLDEGAEGIEAAGIEAPRRTTLQPSGRKSHAVLSLGAGMPGVSGEGNISAPPISGALAKDPGVVTSGVEAGLRAPRRGVRCLMVGRAADMADLRRRVRIDDG